MVDNKQIAKDGTFLAIATVLASAGNYILNIALCRWLSPAEFADANFMVTLMLIITAVAVSFQLIAAKYASVETNNNLLALHWLKQRSWMFGLLAFAILTVCSPLARDIFHTQSALPFVILGIGMPFYLAQAVGRGILQGRLQFRPLALTFIVEMIIRVVLGLVLVQLNMGVNGATIALSASFLATWLTVAKMTSDSRDKPQADVNKKEVLSYAQSVGILLAGQIVINNVDILVAKRVFSADDAGIYAAIALVGRAVFFLSWSVATTIFPASARNHSIGVKANGLINGGVLVITFLGVSCAVGALLLGNPILAAVFGSNYEGLSRPLAGYAIATTMFAVANLLATHHLSTGRVRECWLILIGGGLQTMLLLTWNNSIDMLIIMQLISMSLLLTVVSASHLLLMRTQSTIPLRESVAKQ